MKSTKPLAGPQGSPLAFAGTNENSGSSVNKNNTTAEQQPDKDKVGVEQQLLFSVNPKTKEIVAAFTLQNEVEANGKLSSKEKARFKELEEAVEQGFDSFVEVAISLHEINETKLYRQDFGSFDEYCKE